ncbi:MAG: type II toxin-antitoxin system VapC family toxin [Desulfobacterales bacterium]|nr:type II toxin-antitoxin system VapC family toxin [Desulfobacterales bacterium]
MSKYFFDTSAIVKRYHGEDGSDLINRLFAESNAEFVISDISIIEFYSALSLKVRVGEINEENFISLRKLFSQDIKGGLYKVAEFTNTEKLESTKLLLKYAKKYSLKTLDAMQLSVVKSVNRSEVKAVVCADKKFCKIIALEDFSVINPIIGDNL